MNLNRNLILAGISTLVLIMLLATLKMPLNIASGHLNPEVTLTESIAPTINTFSSLTLTHAVNPDKDKPKKILFPPKGIPVLMYHSISTICGNSLGVPVKQFSEEMEWLHHQNYHSISTEDLYQALANKAQVPEKPILITFDDGYGDNYTSAWPLLRQNGFRATFFIITNSLGHGMMNWNQLNDLFQQGNSIGSHTLHHLDLASLTYHQQESELAISKRELENHLGIRVQALCFPSGKYSKSTLEMMPKLGYRLGFTTKSGNVHLGDDLLTLKRVRIYGGMPLTSFQTLFP